MSFYAVYPSRRVSNAEVKTWVFGIGRGVGGAKRQWERKGGNVIED